MATLLNNCPENHANCFKLCSFKMHLLKLMKVPKNITLYMLLQIVQKSMSARSRKIQFPIKVRKTARIRNRYDQVPHLSQDTKWDRNKIITNITTSPFPTGETQDIYNTNDPQTSTALERSVKIFYRRA